MLNFRNRSKVVSVLVVLFVALLSAGLMMNQASAEEVELSDEAQMDQARRSLQHRLEESISEMDGVARATVEIGLADPSRFFVQNSFPARAARASVVVRTYGEVPEYLGLEIARLVSDSVLAEFDIVVDLEDISVIDTLFTVLFPINVINNEEVTSSIESERSEFREMTEELESLLADAISEMDGVIRARVVLQIPHDNNFIANMNIGRASVIVDTYRLLSEYEGEQIARFVSRSVPFDLHKYNVGVTDADSNILFSQYAWSTYGAFIPESNIKHGLGQFQWPLSNTFDQISSGFGYRANLVSATFEEEFHAGIDIPAPAGVAVFAAADGYVTFTGSAPNHGSRGSMIKIDHGNGYSTRYEHLSRIHVDERSVTSQTQLYGRQFVRQGEYIADVGGSHLHFEIHFDGNPINPMDYFYYGDFYNDFD